MKKFTLFAGMALVALGASAQFTMEDGSVKAFADANGKGTYYNINMSEYSVEQLTNAGNTVVQIGPDEITRFLYVWDNTFAAGEATTPAPGWDGEENMDFSYTSLTVGTAGWSGCGWFNSDDTPIAANFNAESIFHMSYCTTASAPAGVGVTLLADAGKFALGSFTDNGTAMPSAAPAPTDDWQTVCFSFGDLGKLWSAFTMPDAVKGNYLVLLAGGVTGTNIAVDNCFFFTPDNGNAIEGVSADEVNAPVEYFNLQGVKIANPENGLYIKVQGNKATKVVL